MSLSTSQCAAIDAAIKKIRSRYLRAASKLASAVMEDAKIDPGPVRALRATLDELEKALEASAGASQPAPAPIAQPAVLAERLKSLDALLDEERGEPETVRPAKASASLSSTEALKAERSGAVKQESKDPPAKPVTSKPQLQPKPRPAGASVISGRQAEDAALATAVALSEAAPAPSVGEAGRESSPDRNGEAPAPPENFDPSDAAHLILMQQTKIGEAIVERIDRNGNILTG